MNNIKLSYIKIIKIWTDLRMRGYFSNKKRGITLNNFIAVKLAVVVDPDLQIRGGEGVFQFALIIRGDLL